MSKTRADFSGLDKLKSLLSEFKQMDGRDIRDSLFSNDTVISKTPEEAKERGEYEDFLKTGESSSDEQTLNKNAEHFINDIIKKHIK